MSDLQWQEIDADVASAVRHFAAGAVRAATLVAQELPGAIARFQQAIDP